MTKLYPNLRFNDVKCKEAMNFYKSIFGGELNLMTVGGSPVEKEMPPEAKDRIMHSELKTKNFTLLGSDMMRDKAVIGDQICLCLDCDDEKEMREYFSKLKEGGEVFMEIEKPFWGGLFGMVTDKYGVEWMVTMADKSTK